MALFHEAQYRQLTEAKVLCLVEDSDVAAFKRVAAISPDIKQAFAHTSKWVTRDDGTEELVFHTHWLDYDQFVKKEPHQDVMTAAVAWTSLLADASTPKEFKGRRCEVFSQSAPRPVAGSQPAAWRFPFSSVQGTISVTDSDSVPLASQPEASQIPAEESQPDASHPAASVTDSDLGPTPESQPDEEAPAIGPGRTPSCFRCGVFFPFRDMTDECCMKNLGIPCSFPADEQEMRTTVAAAEGDEAEEEAPADEQEMGTTVAAAECNEAEEEAPADESKPYASHETLADEPQDELLVPTQGLPGQQFDESEESGEPSAKRTRV